MNASIQFQNTVEMFRLKDAFFKYGTNSIIKSYFNRPLKMGSKIIPIYNQNYHCKKIVM